MNKGKRLLTCKQCNRKRFCSRESIPGYNFRYTCSKGHSWIIKGITTERVIAVMQEVFANASLENLFNRDDVFFSKLKR